MNHISLEPHIDEVVAEAEKFRATLESGRAKNIPFILGCFPVMSCKLSSLLFVYHVLHKWPSVLMYGVSGMAKNHDGDNLISHYWLEYKNTAIDLTADQYNIIEERELNREIIDSRPFRPVSIGNIDSMQNYELFTVSGRDAYGFGLSDLAEDFLENLRYSYEALGDLDLHASSSANTLEE